MYEEAFFALLNALHRKYRCNNLALSGGCAMNSVANGKVYLKTPFKKMYLPAAAGDAGGAIGAAFVVRHQLCRSRRKEAHPDSCPCDGPRSDSPLRLDSPSPHPMGRRWRQPDEVSAGEGGRRPGEGRGEKRNLFREGPGESRGEKINHCGEGTGEVSDPLPSPSSNLPSSSRNGRFVMSHAYVGPQSSDAEIRALLDTRQAAITVEHCEVREIPAPA